MKKRGGKLLRRFVFLRDGFNGILALMIYNFLLYLSTAFGVGGIIGQIEENTGYFYLNTFKEFVLIRNFIIFYLLIVLVFAFFLGAVVAKIIRKIKRR